MASFDSNNYKPLLRNLLAESNSVGAFFDHRKDHTRGAISLQTALGHVRRGVSIVSISLNSAKDTDALKALSLLVCDAGCRLKSLRLIDGPISSSACTLLKGLVSHTSDRPHIETLHCCECTFAADCMKTLSQCMLHAGRATSLSSLLITRTAAGSMTTQCVQSLCDVLASPDCSLSTLVLRQPLTRNPREAVTMETRFQRNAAMVNAIRRNTSLRQFDVGRCDVDAPQIVAWCDALISSKTLVQVTINFRPYTKEAKQQVVYQVSRMIAHIQSIRRLRLGYPIDQVLTEPKRCPIDLLCEGIAQNKTLRSFEILYGPEYRGREAEASRQYMKVLAAVKSHPYIAYFDWKTVHPLWVWRRSLPALLPRYQAYQARQSRIRSILQHRAAATAARDAALVWRAAAEGRPLELAKRLRVGVMAGGADRVVEVDGIWLDAESAAESGGHAVCVELLRKAKARESNRRAIYFSGSGTVTRVPKSDGTDLDRAACCGCFG